MTVKTLKNGQKSGPRMVQKWANGVKKIPPKAVKSTPKRCQTDPEVIPKWPVTVPKMFRNHPKMVPFWSPNSPKIACVWAKNGPKRSKMSVMTKKKTAQKPSRPS